MFLNILTSMDSIPSIKRHRLTNWLSKQDPAFCCIQEMHLSDKDRHYLRARGWKTVFQANGPKKQAGVANLISNKINFNQKLSKRTLHTHQRKKKSTKKYSQF
jgi:exonuclease III